MTRNVSAGTMTPITGGSANGTLGGGGGGGMTPGTDGQILVTTAGKPTWTTPNYVATPDLTTTLNSYPTKQELTTTLNPYVTESKLATELAPLILGIEHGAAVIDIAKKPTGTEPESSLYIVATGATDDFAGHDNAVAFLDNGKWIFTTPQVNEAHLNEKTNQIMHWNGAAWNNVGSVAHVGEVATVVYHKCTRGDYSKEIYGTWTGMTRPNYVYVVEWGGCHTCSHDYTKNRYRIYVNDSLVTENISGFGGYAVTATSKWYVDGNGKNQKIEFRLSWDSSVAYKQLWASVTEIRMP